jgi:hypothetical protein
MPRLELVLFCFWLLGLFPIAVLGSIVASMVAPGLNGGVDINPVALVPFALYFFLMPNPEGEKSCHT